MSDLPQDLCEEVHDLALGIVNSSTADDEPLRQFYYQKLVELYETRMEAKRGHPFLTEALADFTTENPERARLYKLAIEQSAEIPTEPLYSKMLSLAETLLEMKRSEEAEAYLVAAKQDAAQHQDSEALQEIESLLRKQSL
jgi:hypothetical protein